MARTTEEILRQIVIDASEVLETRGFREESQQRILLDLIHHAACALRGVETRDSVRFRVKILSRLAGELDEGKLMDEADARARELLSKLDDQPT